MNQKTNTKNALILVCCSAAILFSAIFFLGKVLFSKSAPVSSKLENYRIELNKNPINIEEILLTNTENKIEQEMIVEEIDLEYTTEYKNNSDLPSGTMQVVQEGRDGKQNAVIIKKYENGELISEELVAENLMKASVNRIVEIGTGFGTNNYKFKKGDTAFVTSSLLTVRIEPDTSSQKLATLKKGNEVKIIDVSDDWLYINSSESIGYIAKDCVTNINPNKVIIEDSGNEVSKNSLVAKLDFGMNLNIPSGLSLNQFKKVLTGQASDKNSVFANNAEYFYYAEKQYNINGIFLAAVGIHESAWGTSAISLNKKNLFGYGAVDSDPSGGAYTFNTYSEGIDLLARVFKKYYINPAGTAIYDGNVANGKFYSGNTLSSINVKYASDPNWSKGVYKWMQYLYNNL